MHKYVVALCALALIAAATAGAIGLPGGGGKVDTKKFDELIAQIEEIAGSFEAAKGTVDECQTTLAGIAEKHGIADLFSDPANIAALKDAVTDDDKAALTAQAEALATVPDDLNAAVTKATELTTKVPDAISDLATQITENPLAAKDLQDKQAQLETGKAALETVSTEAPALVESSTNLGETIAGLM
jgi:chromosome segregation ATPase